MAKEPKANWSLYTKAELVKMIKNYDKRQAVLLNRIAKLEGASTARNTLLRDDDPCGAVLPTRFPWQDVLDATKAYNSKEPK